MLSLFTISMIMMIPSAALVVGSVLVSMVESAKKRGKQLATCNF